MRAKPTAIPGPEIILPIPSNKPVTVFPIPESGSKLEIALMIPLTVSKTFFSAGPATDFPIPAANCFMFWTVSFINAAIVEFSSSFLLMA